MCTLGSHQLQNVANATYATLAFVIKYILVSSVKVTPECHTPPQSGNNNKSDYGEYLFEKEDDINDQNFVVNCAEIQIAISEGNKIKMSSLGTSKGILEIAKFGVYVTIPIVLMYSFANNTQNLKKFMGNRSYVVYPPEAQRPPSPEELREMARELSRKNNIR
ncbi:hypothetical protein SO802_026913 [Lithocarpus litseifolius]|uniref:Uncharacterized protein n=1 Tax=Lithocarpus litseifolius TaxID=425828 RepID=A0AAW2C1U4_9ROSI